MIVQVEYDISNEMFILHEIVERLMIYQNIIIVHPLQ